jgi:hypothetical protein
MGITEQARRDRARVRLEVLAMALPWNRTSNGTERNDVERNDNETDESGGGTTTTVMPARQPAATGTAQVDERLAAQRRLEARAATATTAKRQPVTVGSDATEEMVVLGPRARGSMMATLSLVLGLVAALTVLTGVLTGPGVGLGLLAAFAAIGGVAATGHRHVAGKHDAFLGLLLGLAAIVVGTLTLTGNLPWLDTDTDQVMRLRDWLDARAPWLFPNS